MTSAGKKGAVHPPDITLPDEPRAIYESKLVFGVHLWDVSHIMPRIESKRRRRDVAGIDRLFFHHSGALGRPGFAGALASANYVVKQRKNKDGKRAGFPGPAYTFWIPAEDLRDSSGALCVLRLNTDTERSWHTGGKANGRGVSAVFQGNTTARPMTHSHEECAEALIPWAVRRYGLRMPDGLSWHSIGDESGGSSKAACPGKGAESWLRGYRRGYVTDAA